MASSFRKSFGDTGVSWGNNVGSFLGIANGLSDWTLGSVGRVLGTVVGGVVDGGIGIKDGAVSVGSFVFGVESTEQPNAATPATTASTGTSAGRTAVQPVSNNNTRTTDAPQEEVTKEKFDATVKEVLGLRDAGKIGIGMDQATTDLLKKDARIIREGLKQHPEFKEMIPEKARPLCDKFINYFDAPGSQQSQKTAVANEKNESEKPLNDAFSAFKDSKDPVMQMIGALLEFISQAFPQLAQSQGQGTAPAGPNSAAPAQPAPSVTPPPATSAAPTAPAATITVPDAQANAPVASSDGVPPLNSNAVPLAPQNVVAATPDAVPPSPAELPAFQAAPNAPVMSSVATPSSVAAAAPSGVPPLSATPTAPVIAATTPDVPPSPASDIASKTPAAPNAPVMSSVAMPSVNGATKVADAPADALVTQNTVPQLNTVPVVPPAQDYVPKEIMQDELARAESFSKNQAAQKQNPISSLSGGALQGVMAAGAGMFKGGMDLIVQSSQSIPKGGSDLAANVQNTAEKGRA